jgi:hypothetical protein
MRAASALLLALALAGCPRGGAEPADPQHEVAPAAAARPASGFVVVPTTAWLRAAPREDAARVRAGAPSDSCRSAPVEPLWVMRRVAELGDWVAVENLSSIEGAAHCYGQSWPLDHLRLRFWVARADLAQVTRREVRVVYPDDTGFTLSAGVQVTEAEGGYLVAVDDNRVLLEVPADAVGDGYAAPSEHLNASHVAQPDDPPPADHVIVGGRRIPLQMSLDAVAMLYDPDGSGRKMAAYSMRCSEYYSNPIDSAGFYAHGLCGAGLGPFTGDNVEAGTALSWLDGTPAGEAIDEIDVHWPVESPDARTCFQIPLRSDGEPSDGEETLTLCAAPR